MVGQHHAARAHAQGACVARDVSDQHGRGAAGHAVDVVVLGQPEAVVAKPFDVLRQRDRVAEGVCGIPPLHNRGQVEHGKRNAGQGAHARTPVFVAGQGGNAGLRRERRKMYSICRFTWGVYRRIQACKPATMRSDGLIDFLDPRNSGRGTQRPHPRAAPL
ncbi:hypothetical protein D3C72_1534280 [compost metagenome]